MQPEDTRSDAERKRVVRRNLLFLGGAAAVVTVGTKASHWIDTLRPPNFEFGPVPGVSGFRMIDRSDVSSAPVDPFIGLETKAPKPASLRGDLFDLVHFERGTRLPVAEFTDYNCPYCKVLSRDVHHFVETGEIDLSLHLLPLLGPDSVDAARVSLAVDDAQFHRRLMGSQLRMTGEYARVLARDRDHTIGLLSRSDPYIARAFALADRFGIIGTPALIVGRTLVIGRISRAHLGQLIALERKDMGLV